MTKRLLKYVTITVTALWFIGLFALALQGGWRPLGDLPLAWLSYNLAIFIILLIIDHYLQLRSRIFPWVYGIFFVQLVFFNLASIFNWYENSIYLNRLEHVVGSFLVALAVFGAYDHYKKFQKLLPAEQLLAIIGTANLITVLNELVELGLDYWLGTETIGPGLFDTNLDLLMNVTGFAVFGIVFYLIKLYRW